MGASHSRVVGSRNPLSSMLPSEVMIWTCLLSKMALYSESHSCTTERRERFLIAGKIFTRPGLRCRRLRKVMVVAVMVLPFGRPTLSVAGLEFGEL